MDLKDKVVVVTGSTSGLGLELAKAFIKEGAQVVISGREQANSDTVAQELGAFACAADVTKEAEVKALASQIVAKFGRIDVWVNNAGVWFPHCPIEELEMEHARTMIEVNLYGTMHGSRAALIEMRKQNSGAIVNILSTSALTGRPGSAAYCASKFAASGFTKSLQMEVAASGIQAIGVYPGGMQTHLFDAKKPEDMAKYMDPAEVAQKILVNLKKDQPEAELIIKRN